VNAVSRRAFPLLLIAAASAWIAFSNAALGDYPIDAGPAVDALAGGHISAFLGSDPDMGPVSIILRAPFAALGGGDLLSAYQWGSLICVFTAGLLGLYLARLAGRRGSGAPAQALLAGVCLLNPLTFAALQAGHPEEILTASLAVGAVAVASQGHSGRAALLLGLAIASKQWAVIAILPVLMALPSGRVRAGLGAAAVVLALTLPAVLAHPHAYFETQRSLAVESQYVTPWSAWFSTTAVTDHQVPALHTTVQVHYASGFVARFSHPLIVLVALLIPLAVALRRRRFGLSAAEAMALLTLLSLLRCVLDPVDNLYYHEPLLLALVGWDAVASRGLPLRAIGGVAVLELLSRWEPPTLGLGAFNLIYLCLGAATAVAITFVLLRRPRRRVGPVIAETPVWAGARSLVRP
jgi:glycosyl transferase family 87